MKRVFLFLALFATGFALVWWLSRSPRAVAPPPVPERTTQTGGQFTNIEVEDEAGGAKALGVELTGPLAFTQFWPQRVEGEAQKKRLVFDARDVAAVDATTYDASDLAIETFDELDGGRRARLTSPRSRIRLEVVNGKPSLGEDESATLSNVEILIDRGAPITPLILSVPMLTWDRTREVLRSNDRVQMFGTGFDAHGTGLTAEMQSEVFTLERQAKVTLQLPAREPALVPVDEQVTLSTGGDGPIVVRRTIDDATTDGEKVEWIEIHASKDARLTFSGLESVTVVAETIECRGRIVPGPKRTFEIVRAEARGDVVATSRGDTFRAQTAVFDFAPGGVLAKATLEQDVVLEAGPHVFRSRAAVFEFDAKGELAKAVLRDDPTGDLSIGRFLPANQPELKSALARVEGVGPLTLSFVPDESKSSDEKLDESTTSDDQVDVELVGPATIKVAEAQLTLSADERLHSRFSEKEGMGHVELHDAARVEYGKNTVVSDMLRVAWTLAEDGETTVIATSNVPTTVHAEPADQAPFDVTARGGIEARAVGKEFDVPLARDVTFDVKGKRPFVATAREVRDFVARTGTFTALGDVTYTSSQGTATAQRAESLGAEEYLLTGTSESKAEYRFAGDVKSDDDGERTALTANASALSIRVLSNRVEARDEVVANVRAAEGRVQLETSELDLDVAPLVVGDELARRPFKVRARGGVEAEIERDGELAHVRSATFAADGDLVPREEDPSTYTVELRDLIAEGGVRVDWAGRGDLVGHGDRFTLDAEGKGRLSAAEGERVHATGRFVASQVPYKIECDWLEFDDERLDAANVHVRLQTEVEPLGAAEEALRGALLTPLADEAALEASDATARADGVSNVASETPLESNARDDRAEAARVVAPTESSETVQADAVPRSDAAQVDTTQQADTAQQTDTAPQTHATEPTSTAQRADAVQGDAAPQDDTTQTSDTAQQPAAPSADEPQEERPPILHELRADRLTASRSEILLDGHARVQGRTMQGEDWLVEAGQIRLRGNFEDVERFDMKTVTSLVAQGGFHGRFGANVTADGERLDGVPDRVRIEGQPAHLTLFDAEWESNVIQYDMLNMLLSTDKGTMRSRVATPGPSWSLSYESMQPFDQGDSTILVLRSPRFRYGSMQLNADWMLSWLDREEWRRSTKRVIDEKVGNSDLRVLEPTPTPPPPTRDADAPPPKDSIQERVQRRLADLRDDPIFRVLAELYVEGNVEFYDRAERIGRAKALYFDIIDEHGWIQDADVVIDINVRSMAQRLRAKSEWMRITSNLQLRASSAVITSCDYDTPHYVIETGDLRLSTASTSKDARLAFSVEARENAIRFQDGFSLPLPPLVVPADQEGKPLIDHFVFGDSARFGASFRAAINADLGSIGLGVGNIFSGILDLPDAEFRGGWKYRLGFLGSRGFLLGAGLELEESDRFKLDIDLDGIPDRRSDRGLLRVDRDDRSLLRGWLRARGRYMLGEKEWVDLAFSRQTDPGVQAEFFERDFVTYEQKDTYLHWRKAKESDYFQASAKVRVEDRADIDELPSAGAFRGRTELTELWGNQLLYTGYADAAFLRRREGDLRYFPAFADGLGDREVARFDTEHRLELPFPLGIAAARATPYLSARGTAWDRGIDEDESPYRAALLAGVETATTFWKRYPKGSIHTITPSIGVHTDVVEEDHGAPVRFDPVEDPIDGTFVDVGVRNRWWIPETRESLDLDVRTSYGSGQSDDLRDGLLPIATLAELLTWWGEVPIGMTHDGRYDTRNGDTQYSRTFVGFEPVRSLGIETGYHRGLDVAGERLYEAFSVAARWRWTTKWELEMEQTHSLADDRGLGHSFVLRRLGHDFVMETELDYRAGEGTSFSINVLPMLSWRRSGLGLLDRWLGLYH